MKQTLLISLLFLLTACGGGGNTSDTPESESSSTPAETVTPAEPVVETPAVVVTTPLQPVEEVTPEPVVEQTPEPVQPTQPVEESILDPVVSTSNPTEEAPEFVVVITPSIYSCGTKQLCTQMEGCAEAKFHLAQCGLSNLDRDNDGIPCESICNSSTVGENTSNSTTVDPVQPAQPAVENTPDPVVATPEPTEEVTPEPVVTTPDPVVEPRNCSTTGKDIPPIAITGDKAKQSATFHLEKGISIFTLVHRDFDFFSAVLRDSEGEYIELLANEIGLFFGTIAVEIETEGDYYLDVNSDTPWTTDITQPRPKTAEFINNFSGSYQTASPIFYLEQGLAVFSLTNAAESGHFAGVLRSIEGEYIELLANETGDFEGSKLARIEKSDCYLINISSDGQWAAQIDQPIDPTGNLVSNFAGTGQKVTEFFLLSGTGSVRFSYTHQGDGFFSAVLYDKRGNTEVFIANEVGAVTKTVTKEVNKSGVYIIQVQADSDATWAITIE